MRVFGVVVDSDELHFGGVDSGDFFLFFGLSLSGVFSVGVHAYHLMRFLNHVHLLFLSSLFNRLYLFILKDLFLL